MTQWANDLISRPERVIIPIMTHPGIEICNKTVKEAVTNGVVHAEAIIRLNEEYSSAAASTVIMDLTVEAEAFGAEVVFPEDEIPSVIGRLVSDLTSVEVLEIPTLNSVRVQEYLKANRLARENIQDKPIFGGCIGPFSLAGRLFDLSEMMMALYVEPDTITLLLEKCTRFLINYCCAIKDTGVGGIIIAEPAAGLVSNDDCLKYSSEYIKKIVNEVQDDNFMIILHNCGNTGHCTDAMVKSGAKGLHFGNKIDMFDALQNCPKDVLVMGNLDPVGLIKQGKEEDVRKVIMELLERTASYRNFVLSTGCDVPPHVPFENIEVLYESLAIYNKQFVH